MEARPGPLLVFLCLLLLLCSFTCEAKKSKKGDNKDKLPVCLYLRTYKGHLPWLPWLFASAEKFFGNRNETVIAFPATDEAEILPILQQTMPSGNYKIVLESDDLPGIYQQQVSKLNADKHCLSEFIMHIDSRTFFYRKVDKSLLFWTNKKGEDLPYQFFSYYSELGRPEVMKWREVTRHVTKLPIEENFMVVNHHVYPRSLYAKVRAFMEKTHKQSLEEFIAARMKVEGVCRACVISEYNLLGAYMYYFEYESAHWIDVVNLVDKAEQTVVFKKRLEDKKALKPAEKALTKAGREKSVVRPRLSANELKALKGEFLLVARTEEQGTKAEIPEGETLEAYAGIKHKEPTESYVTFMRQVLLGQCVPDSSTGYQVACGPIPIPNTNSPLWPNTYSAYIENVYKYMLEEIQKEVAEERAKNEKDEL